MKLLNKILILLMLMANIQCLLASEINGIRFWQDPEKTRLVFDLNDEVEYKLFTLENPYRLVVDIENTQLKIDLNKVDVPKQLVSNIRASQEGKKLRLVIDLKSAITTNDFLLKPFQSYGHRLVVDLGDENAKKEIVKTLTSINQTQNREIIIAIDAGHGGEDPGALGPKKTLEKNITLTIAKQLANAINNEQGMKAILTRRDDYFVPLRKRTDIARENKADLFISIHADGFHDKNVKGSSVWVLSPAGANSEMGRWLEQKEEASDLAGGIDISHKDPLVAQVLLDLSMHYSVGASINVGELVRQQLIKVMPQMHGKILRKAGFVVLKMPDIPSMLVETGFISNPTEEKLLKTDKHQKKIVNAVLSGIKSYFKENAPDGSLYASLAKTKAHMVKSGDTLSEIANLYGVSMSKLKSYNNLKSNNLRIGQKLLIPGG